MAKKKKFTDDSEDVSKEAMRRLVREQARRAGNERTLAAYWGEDSQVAMDERTAANEGMATKKAMANASYMNDKTPGGFSMEYDTPKKKKRSK